jgi:hypothetical protein
MRAKSSELLGESFPCYLSRFNEQDSMVTRFNIGMGIDIAVGIGVGIGIDIGTLGWGYYIGSTLLGVYIGNRNRNIM